MATHLAFLVIASVSLSVWAQPSSKGSKGGWDDTSSSAENGVTASGDVGCNYVNVGGAGMPVDYCSRVQYQGAYVSMQWKCNDDFTGIEMEMYFASNCNGEPLISMDYTEC